MINATTVSSPFDIVTDRSSTNTQKSDSASDFSSMLSSKLSDQPHEVDREIDRAEDRNTNPQHELKPADKPKPEAKDDHSEAHSTLETKQDVANEDAKPESKDKIKADSSKDANDSKTDSKNIGKEAKTATDEVNSEAVNAQAVNAAQQNANAQANAAPAKQEETFAKTVDVSGTKVAVSTTAATLNPEAIKNGVNAFTDGAQATNSAQTLVESAKSDSAQMKASSQVIEQPIADQSQTEQLSDEVIKGFANAGGSDATSKAKPDAKPAEDKKTEKSAAKTSFFGLNAKMIDSDETSKLSLQNQKTSSDNASANTQDKQEAPLLAGKRRESSRFFVQSTGSENNADAASSVNSKADASKAVPVDTTFSPQVIKAISLESQPAVDVPVIKAATDVQTRNEVSTATDASATVAPAPETRSNFDGTLRGLETAKSQPSTPSNTELQTKIMDQIVREIKLRNIQGQNNLTVKLNPAELGQIHLQISQTENGLTTQINTTNEQVRGLLQAHIPALTNALAEAGLRMDQVSVTSEASFNSLMQDNNASGTAYQQKNRSRQQHSGNAQEVNVNPAVINAANGFGAAGSVGYSWLA